MYKKERNNEIFAIEEKDLKELLEIQQKNFNNKQNYENIQNMYKLLQENKDIYVLGYYIKDCLVGTLTLNVITLTLGKEATIWDLAIKEEYRRLGIATKLMNKAEEIAKSYIGYDENRDKAFVKQIK